MIAMDLCKMFVYKKHWYQIYGAGRYKFHNLLIPECSHFVKQNKQKKKTQQRNTF